MPVNVPAVLRPVAFSDTSPAVQAASASAVPIHTLRGRWAIQAPVRAHRPVRVGSGVPKAGRTGQNTQRPQATSSAGSRVSIATRATATPIAQTGPRPRVEFMSAISRHSIDAATVAELARIAGPARCRAAAIASCRSSWRRSSSR